MDDSVFKKNDEERKKNTVESAKKIICVCLAIAKITILNTHIYTYTNW